MMPANQVIGPVLWPAIPAAPWLATRPADTARRRAVRLFGLLALSWFVVLSYLLFHALSSPWLTPRYQTAPWPSRSACGWRSRWRGVGARRRRP